MVAVRSDATAAPPIATHGSTERHSTHLALASPHAHAARSAAPLHCRVEKIEREIEEREACDEAEGNLDALQQRQVGPWVLHAGGVGLG